MKRHVGLLMGSFNPVHIGHLALANYMREMHQMDEVWLVVSPLNPFKDEVQLIDSQHRLAMVNVALQNQPGYCACDIELSMPVPSYSINTLDKLTELHPDIQFSIIMGSDNIQRITRWKDYERLLANHRLYIYPRPGYSLEDVDVNHEHIIMTQAPMIDISSTFIREMLRSGHQMHYFLPHGVQQYITENQLYQS